MMKSLRSLAPAACAAALLVGFGVGIAAAQPVIVEKAMPAPIVEVVPAAPGAGYNWVPGHWSWRGGAWFWVKGHHIRGVVAAMPAPIVEVVPARPSPAHVWIKGHHVFEGGRWVWHPGIWFRA
jgi:WXXGXW repeat (2 copies)